MANSYDDWRVRYIESIPYAGVFLFMRSVESLRVTIHATWDEVVAKAEQLAPRA